MMDEATSNGFSPEDFASTGPAPAPSPGTASSGFSPEDIAKAKCSGEIQLNIEKAERCRRMIRGLEGSLGLQQEPGQQSIGDRIRGHLVELERLERLIEVGQGYKDGH